MGIQVADSGGDASEVYLQCSLTKVRAELNKTLNWGELKITKHKTVTHKVTIRETHKEVSWEQRAGCGAESCRTTE